MSDTPEYPKELLEAVTAQFNETFGNAEPETATTVEEVKPEPKPEEKKTEQPKEEPKGKEEVKDGSLQSAKDTKSEKPPSKWAQNEQRKNKTWAEINAQREADAREREELRQEKERLQREREEWQRKTAIESDYRDKHGRTAREYLEAAKRFEHEGDKELAEQTRQLAEQVRREGEQVKEQARQQEFAHKWESNYKALAEKHPDLKNKDSELYKYALDLLNRYRPLREDVNGLNLAVEAFNLKQAAKDSETSKAEINRLKAELETLQKKLSIGAGVPAEPPKAEKSFDQLSLEEQKKRLEQAAQQADRDSGFID